MPIAAGRDRPEPNEQEVPDSPTNDVLDRMHTLEQQYEPKHQFRS